MLSYSFKAQKSEITMLAGLPLWLVKGSLWTLPVSSDDAVPEYVCLSIFSYMTLSYRIGVTRNPNGFILPGLYLQVPYFQIKSWWLGFQHINLGYTVHLLTAIIVRDSAQQWTVKSQEPKGFWRERKEKGAGKKVEKSSLSPWYLLSCFGFFSLPLFLRIIVEEMGRNVFHRQESTGDWCYWSTNGDICPYCPPPSQLHARMLSNRQHCVITHGTPESSLKIFNFIKAGHLPFNGSSHIL